MVYVGTNDGNRGAGFAVKSSDGSIVWSFYGGAEPGESTPMSTAARSSGDTWGPLRRTVNSCALTAGVTPWIHPSVDPELDTVYWSFGNVRSCGSSQDGQQRPGDNLFGNSIVAVDAKTGAYKWHFQSIRHDIADMDNVSPTVIGDIQVGGETKKAIYYGSKSSMTFILDRTNGQPITGVTKCRSRRIRGRAVAHAEDPGHRQLADPVHPVREARHRQHPRQSVAGRAELQRLSSRCGRQSGLHRAELSGRGQANPDDPYRPGSFTAKADQRPHRRAACTTRISISRCCRPPPRTAVTTSRASRSSSTGTCTSSRGPTRTSRTTAAQAATVCARLGSIKGGGILALDAKTGKVLWDNWTDWLGLDMAHGQTTLATASDLVFVGRDDGYIVALDVQTGEILWKFQSGAGVEGGMATYSIDGEQYVVALSFVGGDYVTAFKLGGTLGELPTPVLSAGAIRQGGGGTPTPGSTMNNTIYLARANLTADTAGNAGSIGTGGMVPNNLGVPVGTTVTFLNPGAETFPHFPNLKEHCATQFFEGAVQSEAAAGPDVPVHVRLARVSTGTTTAPIRARPAASM